MMTKITKRDNYNFLLSLLPNMLEAELINAEEDERLSEFLNHELEQLSKRADSARKYAKKSAKAEDELTQAVVDLLAGTAESMTIPDMVVQIPEELHATAQKLTYRLNKLVDAKVIERNTISVKEEGRSARRINTYCYVGVEEETLD